MQLHPLDLGADKHIAAIASLWNAACGPDLAITERAARFNTLPTAGASQEGRLAVQAGRPVGFVLASVLTADPITSPPDMGWIDSIAVRPEQQQQGVGRALLDWAEEWLRSQGCLRVRLGGSLRPFAPGLPSGLYSEPFFRARGYENRPQGKTDWDVARRLTGYTARSARLGQPAECRPAHPGEEGAMVAFFESEFPGRWRFEFQEHLRGGGRISDYMVLVASRGVEGFCQLTFEDSLRPLDRFFMNSLPRPWGQLGPIGVARSCRGGGLGGLLLDAGLSRLRDAGVDGCVIDWTSLLDLYGKFGFQPFRRYEVLQKQL